MSHQQPSAQPITVLKLGSSVLPNERHLPSAVQEIYREWRHGQAVVAVVSAFGSTTDDLLKRAEQLGLPTQPGATAALLATGEAAAAALLTLALQRSGIPTTLLDAHSADLVTTGDLLDAELVGAASWRIRQELRRGVVVIPGFVGRDPRRRTAVLGRGGSDLTAVFLARELGATCRLYKDVDGLYTGDPALPGSTAARFVTASWETAARLGGGVIQPKAIRLAEDGRVEIELRAPASGPGTRIGLYQDCLAPPAPALPPLRVALLGCGTVGGGVLERLLALPRLFAVTGVATRSAGRDRSAISPRPHRHPAPHLVPHLLHTDPLALVERDADVVVELLGGEEPARSAVVRALERGRHVVSANKLLLAADIERLATLAARHGATLRYSAAVGGALPALELARRHAGRVRALGGVLNGTSNFVLERCAAGVPFAAAVCEARAAGYAEVDPSRDLDGSDAAQKLSLLIGAAFGVALPWQRIPRRGIVELRPEPLATAARRGSTLRLVASCERGAAGLRPIVQPLALPLSHPLAQVQGAGNALTLETTGGELYTMAAQGAGRWPTSEAVLADLLDLHAERRLTHAAGTPGGGAPSSRGAAGLVEVVA